MGRDMLPWEAQYLEIIFSRFIFKREKRTLLKTYILYGYTDTASYMSLAGDFLRCPLLISAFWNSWPVVCPALEELLLTNGTQ